MKFTDRATLGTTRKTADGYLVGDVRCARTGIQQYLGYELGLGTMDVINVYRPESEVFHKDSLASFAHKPVTDNHPPTDVTAANWKQFAGGDVGDEVMRDGDFVRVPYKLMDANLIANVEAGKQEVSMGYTATLEFVDGITDNGEAYQAIQRDIRINHLAIVDRGRAGHDCRLGDSAVKWGVSPTTTTENTFLIGDNRVNTKILLIDGRSIETTDQGAVELRALVADKAAVAQKLVDAETTHAEALRVKDTELAAKDAEIDNLKASKLTDAEIEAKVQARSALLAKAKMVAKDADFIGMSDAEIKKAAVSAVIDAATLADKSDAYIDARFDMLCDDAATNSKDTFADTFKQNGAPNPSIADHGQNAYETRTLNAWKQEK